MQNEFAAPAPGRYCRMQILAFLVLNLLGSCVHIPNETVREAITVSKSSQLQNTQKPAQPANKP